MEAQQVRRLFLPLVVAFYIVCIFHSQQTMWFESEAQLRLENDVLIKINPPEAGPPRQTPSELCPQR